jgi:hypothetical protein
MQLAAVIARLADFLRYGSVYSQAAPRSEPRVPGRHRRNLNQSKTGKRETQKLNDAIATGKRVRRRARPIQLQEEASGDKAKAEKAAEEKN